VITSLGHWVIRSRRIVKAEEKQITTFEDLEVWQLCRALRKEIYKVTKTFPKDEEGHYSKL